MSNITEMIGSVPCPKPMTIETIKAAIDKLNEKPQLPEDNPLCGVFEVKECAWMKGMEVIVLSGDKAYCWPGGLAGKEVKVIRLPDTPTPELSFKWDFEGVNLNL